MAEALALMAKYRISGVPVTVGPKLVGILTNRDLRFETRTTLPVSELMTKENLITVPVGTTLEEAQGDPPQAQGGEAPGRGPRLQPQGPDHRQGHPEADQVPERLQGLARAGCGSGPRSASAADTLERVAALVEAKVDVVVVDTAHGHTEGVRETVEKVQGRPPRPRARSPATWGPTRATADLIAAGVSAVKVGMGPGSICTTRVVSGAGMPQITAIAEAARAAARSDTPIIADGGVKFSGDVTKAIAAGAASVMIGSLFAGTDESPGELDPPPGPLLQVLPRDGLDRRDEGRAPATATSRSSRPPPTSSCPRASRGWCRTRGPLSAMVQQLVGGLRAGMGYCGATTIRDFQTRARFVKISPAGLKESHVHDVIITKEAPNYRIE